MPTAEQTAARHLRLMRQGRDWSQQEVANRMKAFGYSWRQSTIGKIETDARPVSLNELADFAAMYGVPVAQFLESGAPDDLEALEREIEALTEERAMLEHRMTDARAALEHASFRHAELAAALARIEGRLQGLMRWHPRTREGGGRK
jgi:transcriptional regulator with XRE-family HTH domain